MNPIPPPSADRPFSQDEIEERAIDEYARGNPVDYAAAAWHLRQTKGFENAEEEREFAAWLSADPAHEAAFRLTERAFDELRGFSPRERARLMAGIGALADAPPDAFRRPPAIGAFFGRPLFPRLAAATCAAFLLLAAGWLVLGNRARLVFEQRHASARGQQSSLSLPDGSVLFFDTLT
jgi:transmembrane sensor